MDGIAQTPTSRREAVRWRTSRSCSSNGTCVRVGSRGPLRALGDTKNPDTPAILLTVKQLGIVIDRIKAGQYDLA